MRHVQKLDISEKSTILVLFSWNLRKCLPLKVIIFTKFHEDQTKNVDLFLMSNFWTCLIFSDFVLKIWFIYFLFNIVTQNQEINHEHAEVHFPLFLFLVHCVMSKNQSQSPFHEFHGIIQYTPQSKIQLKI